MKIVLSEYWRGKEPQGFVIAVPDVPQALFLRPEEFLQLLEECHNRGYIKLYPEMKGRLDPITP